MGPLSAGIGTQALPLASLGYDVVARDLSPSAIRRLRREAQGRGLAIDAATADMRDPRRSVAGAFDAVISFDNSVPHLLTDADIVTALRGWADLLAPRGVVLLSVRDYDAVDRSPNSVHVYGERTRRDRRYRMRQEWAWYDEARYRTTMVGFGDRLSDEEIWAALAFIKSRWPETVRRRQAEINRRAAQ